MQARRYLWTVLAMSTAVSACGDSGERLAQADNNTAGSSMNSIAEQYVRLALAIGQHDPDYVDAYYGPPEWKPADGAKRSLDDLVRRAADLQAELADIPEPSQEVEALRHRYLRTQLSAMAARLRMLKGERLSFDEESKALYDATAPVLPESHFEDVLGQLEQRFPGEEPLVERYETWRRAFMIPRERLDFAPRHHVSEAPPLEC